MGKKGGVMKTRSKIVQAVVLVAMTALLSGCAGKIIDPPDMFLEKISIQKIGISGMKMNIFFDVRNINPHPMVLRYINYDLVVNDRKIGKGYFTEEIQFGEMENKRVKSELKISWFKLPQAIKKVFDQDMVHAKVRGKFTVLHKGRKLQLPFNSEADIPVTKSGFKAQP